MTSPIVIVDAKRTAMGEYLGMFKNVPAPQLAAATLSAILKNVDLDPKDIDEVIYGCVLPAGVGQAPARQAAIFGGLPHSVPATTINKMCGSGMKAVMMACDNLLSGNASIVVAGGMENMSRAPYLLDKARGGYRMGHGKLYDHMFIDGLEDVYETGTLTGVFAERCAKHYTFSRQEQDDFALTSLDRAQTAIKTGAFLAEIAPHEAGSVDELPQKAKPEKIPQLKPAFAKDGTVTAATSSGISDGASTVLLMRESEAKRRGLKPIARILNYASHAQAPEWFTTAPIGAITKVLQRTNTRIQDYDLFEINEAFAVVTLACMKDLEIPHKIVNVNGGACALGHPVGATGTRIITTLIHALTQRKLKKGIASLCIGGGEATALALELI